MLRDRPVNVAIVGAGPAGLYLAILLKRDAPRHQVTVYERNRLEDTFGFGVVFSDETLENVGEADPETNQAMAAAAAHWEEIEIHYRGTVIQSTGHRFSGLERKTLLELLARRASSLGVEVHWQREIKDLSDCGLPAADLIVAADGAASLVRERMSEQFQPQVDWRRNRFVWLGTTRPFPAFTFYFKPSPAGLWRTHAYRYTAGRSTFIVEAREETWKASGLDENDERATLAYLENLFRDELNGHRLLANRSIWRRFPTVRNARWHSGNVVLLGDAAHTAHFSVGSGTKLAMEDAIALAAALRSESSIPAALASYEATRRPLVESLQRAAQASLEWFESTERYQDTEPLQFAFSLLTRSLRITHDNLKLRDPALVAKVDRWFAGQAARQSRRPVTLDPAPPPLFTPYRLRELVLPNRVVVSSMCQYRADDGLPNDWHLVHLASRAIGGAGLVMTEMTDVSREGRISPGCCGMYLPDHVAGWRRIVEFVHQESEARIGIQLAHAGRKGSTRVPWEGEDEPLAEGNWPLIGPSPIPYRAHNQTPREMMRSDMDEVAADFVRATRMAHDAGFDLIELHLAHGYLLASFISPLTNRRTDGYGGSLANRMRYPLEIVTRVRAEWPDAKPLSVRISATDWAPGGMEPHDSVEVARMAVAAGADIVDVSAGQTVPEGKPVYGRQFQTPFSDRIRHEARVPTMTVGNISSPADVNTILAAGRADLVVLARAHLWDPYWTRHAALDLGYALPWPPMYATLNRYTPRMR
ncbi:MAG TPA: bifunctional salicylyl-CoA 5-hydroxylase/oxidoreductase [Gemmatimonadales bacterium]|nr:bifunctional salicylyl-CoA 5-hydroxylase/oxidoreductase [Gemmatimonadales bacterium]